LDNFLKNIGIKGIGFFKFGGRISMNCLHYLINAALQNVTGNRKFFKRYWNEEDWIYWVLVAIFQ